MGGAPPLALALVLPCLALTQTSPPASPGNSTSNSTEPSAAAPPLSVVLSAALPAALAALALGALLVALGLRLRERRRSEGSYRPSREEQVGGARAPPPGPAPLRLPPEERLI
ncbi:protein crumbs homolog 3 [Melopsittacus undulatus]|uniref:protein crumbs homolog 3 n=1 Tax=Melopsittacus undulatus TaxID=13146 RepID=UPI00146A718E|nr:protein crumbs homolog 3 [Melopsittacus undulatus]